MQTLRAALTGSIVALALLAIAVPPALAADGSPATQPIP
jgi:hypothetical protein